MTADEAHGFAAVGWFGPGPAPHAAGGGCTAVLVAPDKVLTATHCLGQSETTPPARPGAFVFAPGWPAAGPAALYHAASVALPEARSLLGGALPFDVALVTLQTPVPGDVAQPLPLGLAEALPEVATVIGYLHDAPDAPVINDACRFVATDGPVLAFACRAQGGYSGGPVLVRGPGGWQVVAITVARGAKPATPDAPPPAVGLYAVVPAPELVEGLAGR
jgi:V8-like Glu-specific endopeptidase